MEQRSTRVIATCVVVVFLQSMGLAQEEEAERPNESPSVTVVRAHALGLWYPLGAGEVSHGRDSAEYDSAVSLGLSIELAHRLADSGFGLGFGARFSRVTFDYEVAVYGGTPPWGWIHSSSADYTMLEPFISFEFGAADRPERSYRFGGQIGYHGLNSPEGYPSRLSGFSIGLEYGLCPAAAKRSRILMDLAVRGSVILPEGDREEVMFLISVGVGINWKL